jgi:hypothetical protein
MTTLQQALQETGIAQVEYDGYTATVTDGQGEFGDEFRLAIQKEAMPPHFSKLFHSLGEIGQEMKTTHAPNLWTSVEPE